VRIKGQFTKKMEFPPGRLSRAPQFDLTGESDCLTFCLRQNVCGGSGAAGNHTRETSMKARKLTGIAIMVTIAAAGLLCAWGQGRAQQITPPQPKQGELDIKRTAQELDKLKREIDVLQEDYKAKLVQLKEAQKKAAAAAAPRSIEERLTDIEKKLDLVIAQLAKKGWATTAPTMMTAPNPALAPAQIDTTTKPKPLTAPSKLEAPGRPHEQQTTPRPPTSGAPAIPAEPLAPPITEKPFVPVLPKQ
jgi:hypothetical protein